MQIIQGDIEKEFKLSLLQNMKGLSEITFITDTERAKRLAFIL